MRFRVSLLTVLAIVGGCLLIPSCSEANRGDQERLADLISGIENAGTPKREQGIKDVRTFLKSSDPQVRCDAARMLYEMKDRSGYDTLIEVLRSPDPVLGNGGLDLRHFAARTFARYRERRAGEALLGLYAKTRSHEVGPAASTLRLKGMVPYLHESLRERLWYTSVADLAVLESQNNQPLFKKLADNEEATPKQRAAAIFGLAMSGDEASLERLIAVATNGKEALPGNHDDLFIAEWHAATYLTNFRGERVVKVFEDMLTWKDKSVSPSIALAYLRYRYPQNKPSREIIKAGLQARESSLGWDYTFLLQLARLSGDPELIALGKQTDETTFLMDVHAGWSNAWIEHMLPDWEGDWPD